VRTAAIDLPEPQAEDGHVGEPDLGGRQNQCSSAGPTALEQIVDEQSLRRKEQGVSQEGLALKSGLDRGYYGGIERGERNLALANIYKLAAALDLPPSALHARAEQIAARSAKKPSAAS
jgi:hypothetical protein